MALCELCGANQAVYDCEIEGSMMHVCTACSKYGKVSGKSNVKIVVVEKKRPANSEPDYRFSPDLSRIVKNAREKQGLKQEDFAKKINERESVLHQIESGHMSPSIGLAHKLERALHIKIVEEIKDDGNTAPSTTARRASGLTIGDMIKKR